MGFGTLFFGYMLILSIGYYQFTDIICALILLFGLYKLYSINQGFKLAAYSAVAFSIFGLAELCFAVYEMFFGAGAVPAGIYSYVSMIRNVIICILTVFMLIGMREVSKEVRLNVHADRCHRMIFGCFLIYLVNVALETPALVSWLDIKVLSIITVLIILSKLILTILILYALSYCYAHIVMPGSNSSDEQKESRFAFINAHRRHVEEKQREYAEYKLKKAEEKRSKGNKSNDKK